jgi:4-hydroxymandelate oxidase
MSFSRRAFGKLGAFFAASPIIEAQELLGEAPGRITPREEIVNVFEVEAVAKRKLPGDVYNSLGGGNRRAFERMTFRPRMLINVTELDLTTELFGEKMFTPILLGPMSEQKRVHPEGELASVRGALAANTVMVVSSRSSCPLQEITSASKARLWYQLYPDSDPAGARSRMQDAVRSGCKAVCLTVGTPHREGPALDWTSIDRLRQGLNVPFLLKGIMSPEDARTAVEKRVDGLVVSNHGGMFAAGLAEPIEMLPAVVDAVNGKVPVLIDGGFRRGTDVLKALAIGARAVMVGRPPMWGLAAYGAEGVQTVLEMLQSELARSMGLSGKVNIRSLDRSLIKFHKR